MRRIATLNDNGNSGSSIATPSRLHRPVEFKVPKNLFGPPWRTSGLTAAVCRPLAASPWKIVPRAASSSRWRIELGGERLSPSFVDADLPGAKGLSDGEVLEIALGHLGQFSSVLGA